MRSDRYEDRTDGLEGEELEEAMGTFAPKVLVEIAKAKVSEGKGVRVLKDVDIEVGTALLGTFYRINIGYASISVVKKELLELHKEIHRIVPEKDLSE